MASEYDHQLIESVTVRRHRLLTALLFGANPHERRWLDSLRLFFLSTAAAAVIAAGCVGYSFVSSLLAENHATPAQPAPLSLSGSIPLCPAGGGAPVQRAGA